MGFDFYIGLVPVLLACVALTVVRQNRFVAFFAFLAAFFSLAQTMRVSATGYEVDRLLSERDRLDARQRQLVADLNRLGREPAIRKQGIDLGLGQLGEPLIVPAR